MIVHSREYFKRRILWVDLRKGILNYTMEVIIISVYLLKDFKLYIILNL